MNGLGNRKIWIRLSAWIVIQALVFTQTVPAYALRQPELAEQRAGLEEFAQALAGDSAAASRVVKRLQSALGLSSSEAAGLEEPSDRQGQREKVFTVPIGAHAHIQERFDELGLPFKPYRTGHEKSSPEVMALGEVLGFEDDPPFLWLVFQEGHSMDGSAPFVVTDRAVQVVPSGPEAKALVDSFVGDVSERHPTWHPHLPTHVPAGVRLHAEFVDGNEDVGSRIQVTLTRSEEAGAGQEETPSTPAASEDFRLFVQSVDELQGVRGRAFQVIHLPGNSPEVQRFSEVLGFEGMGPDSPLSLFRAKIESGPLSSVLAVSDLKSRVVLLGEDPTIPQRAWKLYRTDTGQAQRIAEHSAVGDLGLSVTFRLPSEVARGQSIAVSVQRARLDWRLPGGYPYAKRLQEMAELFGPDSQKAQVFEPLFQQPLSEFGLTAPEGEIRLQRPESFPDELAAWLAEHDLTKERIAESADWIHQLHPFDPSRIVDLTDSLPTLQAFFAEHPELRFRLIGVREDDSKVGSFKIRQFADAYRREIIPDVRGGTPKFPGGVIHSSGNAIQGDAANLRFLWAEGWLPESFKLTMVAMLENLKAAKLEKIKDLQRERLIDQIISQHDIAKLYQAALAAGEVQPPYDKLRVDAVAMSDVNRVLDLIDWYAQAQDSPLYHFLASNSFSAVVGGASMYQDFVGAAGAPDLLIMPAGGGGPITGLALAAHLRGDPTKIVGVISTIRTASLADGLGIQMVQSIARTGLRFFGSNRLQLAETSERSVIKATVELLDAGIDVEPTASIVVAGLFHRMANQPELFEELRQQAGGGIPTIGIILSGHNADPESLAWARQKDAELDLQDLSSLVIPAAGQEEALTVQGSWESSTDDAAPILDIFSFAPSDATSRLADVVGLQAEGLQALRLSTAPAIPSPSRQAKPFFALVDGEKAVSLVRADLPEQAGYLLRYMNQVDPPIIALEVGTAEQRIEIDSPRMGPGEEGLAVRISPWTERASPQRFVLVRHPSALLEVVRQYGIRGLLVKGWGDGREEFYVSDVKGDQIVALEVLGVSLRSWPIRYSVDRFEGYRYEPASGLEEKIPADRVKILVVDDEKPVLDAATMLVGILLDGLGEPMRVDTERQLLAASNYAEAAGIIGQGDLTHLLTDLNLKEPRGGFELAEAARAANPDTLVILHSDPDSAQKTEIQKRLEPGGALDAFVHKNSAAAEEAGLTFVEAMQRHLIDRIGPASGQEEAAAAREHLRELLERAANKKRLAIIGRELLRQHPFLEGFREVHDLLRLEGWSGASAAKLIESFELPPDSAIQEVKYLSEMRPQGVVWAEILAAGRGRDWEPDHLYVRADKPADGLRRVVSVLGSAASSQGALKDEAALSKALQALKRLYAAGQEEGPLTVGDAYNQAPAILWNTENPLARVVLKASTDPDAPAFRSVEPPVQFLQSLDRRTLLERVAGASPLDGEARIMFEQQGDTMLVRPAVESDVNTEPAKPDGPALRVVVLSSQDDGENRTDIWKAVAKKYPTVVMAAYKTPALGIMAAHYRKALDQGRPDALILDVAPDGRTVTPDSVTQFIRETVNSDRRQNIPVFMQIGEGGFPKSLARVRGVKSLTAKLPGRGKLEDPTARPVLQEVVEALSQSAAGQEEKEKEFELVGDQPKLENKGLLVAGVKNTGAIQIDQLDGDWRSGKTQVDVRAVSTAGEWKKKQLFMAAIRHNRRKFWGYVSPDKLQGKALRQYGATARAAQLLSDYSNLEGVVFVYGEGPDRACPRKEVSSVADLAQAIGIFMGQHPDEGVIVERGSSEAFGEDEKLAVLIKRAAKPAALAGPVAAAQDAPGRPSMEQEWEPFERQLVVRGGLIIIGIDDEEPELYRVRVSSSAETPRIPVTIIDPRDLRRQASPARAALRQRGNCGYIPPAKLEGAVGLYGATAQVVDMLAGNLAYRGVMLEADPSKIFTLERRSIRSVADLVRQIAPFLERYAPAGVIVTEAASRDTDRPSQPMILISPVRPLTGEGPLSQFGQPVGDSSGLRLYAVVFGWSRYPGEIFRVTSPSTGSSIMLEPVDGGASESVNVSRLREARYIPLEDLHADDGLLERLKAAVAQAAQPASGALATPVASAGQDASSQLGKPVGDGKSLDYWDYVFGWPSHPGVIYQVQGFSATAGDPVRSVVLEVVKGDARGERENVPEDQLAQARRLKQSDQAVRQLLERDKPRAAAVTAQAAPSSAASGVPKAAAQGAGAEVLAPGAAHRKTLELFGRDRLRQEVVLLDGSGAEIEHASRSRETTGIDRLINKAYLASGRIGVVVTGGTTEKWSAPGQASSPAVVVRPAAQADLRQTASVRPTPAAPGSGTSAPPSAPPKPDPSATQRVTDLLKREARARGNLTFSDGPQLHLASVQALLSALDDIGEKARLASGAAAEIKAVRTAFAEAPKPPLRQPEKQLRPLIRAVTALRNKWKQLSAGQEEVRRLRDKVSLFTVTTTPMTDVGEIAIHPEEIAMIVTRLEVGAASGYLWGGTSSDTMHSGVDWEGARARHQTVLDILGGDDVKALIAQQQVFDSVYADIEHALAPSGPAVKVKKLDHRTKSIRIVTTPRTHRGRIAHSPGDILEVRTHVEITRGPHQDQFWEGEHLDTKWQTVCARHNQVRKIVREADEKGLVNSDPLQVLSLARVPFLAGQEERVGVDATRVYLAGLLLADQIGFISYPQPDSRKWSGRIRKGLNPGWPHSTTGDRVKAAFIAMDLDAKDGGVVITVDSARRIARLDPLPDGQLGSADAGAGQEEFATPATLRRQLNALPSAPAPLTPIGVIASGIADPRGLPLGVGLEEKVPGTQVAYLVTSPQEAAGLEDLGVDPTAIFRRDDFNNLNQALSVMREWLKIAKGVGHIIELGVSKSIGPLARLLERLGTWLSHEALRLWNNWLDRATEHITAA